GAKPSQQTLTRPRQPPRVRKRRQPCPEGPHRWRRKLKRGGIVAQPQQPLAELGNERGELNVGILQRSSQPFRQRIENPPPSLGRPFVLLYGRQPLTKRLQKLVQCFRAATPILVLHLGKCGPQALQQALQPFVRAKVAAIRKNPSSYLQLVGQRTASLDEPFHGVIQEAALICARRRVPRHVHFLNSQIHVARPRRNRFQPDDTY